MPVTPVPVPQLPCDVPSLPFLPSHLPSFLLPFLRLLPFASDLRQKLVKFLQPAALLPDRVSRSASFPSYSRHLIRFWADRPPIGRLTKNISAKLLELASFRGTRDTDFAEQCNVSHPQDFLHD